MGKSIFQQYFLQTAQSQQFIINNQNGMPMGRRFFLYLSINKLAN